MASSGRPCVPAATRERPGGLRRRRRGFLGSVCGPPRLSRCAPGELARAPALLALDPAEQHTGEPALLLEPLGSVRYPLDALDQQQPVVAVLQILPLELKL